MARIKALKPIVFKILGPLIFIVIQFLDTPEGLSRGAFSLVGVTGWMAIWWIFEVVPIAVTALLPIILFPIFDILPVDDTTAQYGHKYVFLYVGGFILATAIERWNLHKRIALQIIKAIGSKASYLILGFMLATAFLSMWISNTATTVMMLPIAIAITDQIKSQEQKDGQSNARFSKALMLGIAYGASIGGISTLIGTPPNLVLAGVVENTYNIKIGFFDWMKFALPISIVLLFICWQYLTKFAFNLGDLNFMGGRKQIEAMLKKLGKISYEEKAVGLIFLLAACLWIFRSLIEKIIPQIDDTIIAIATSFLLFLIPAKNEDQNLLTWDQAVKIPWGIIILFGGGMALASGFKNTGLANWIAGQIDLIEHLPFLVLIIILVTAVNFLTEVTSNLATTAMLLPILVPVAASFDIHPFLIMIAVTLAASCAFMLPVATPPNAIVFGSGYLRIPDMVKKGFFMNIVSIIVISLLIYYYLPFLLGLDNLNFPESLEFL